MEKACDHLGADGDHLKRRGRNPEVVRQRELIALVGVERFGVKVIDLANELRKSRDGVSRWIRRAVDKRQQDPEFAAAAKALEFALSEEG